MKNNFFKSIILSSLFIGFSIMNVNAETICKRATLLHTKECTITDGYSSCAGVGYTEDGSKQTTTITYGNLGVDGTLTSGDAYDCDVNGDGVYDAATERFYYVTDMDENTAVLIYYSNVSNGIPDNFGMYAYDENADAYTNGPATAIKQLPTTAQWSNVSLTNTIRDIKDNTGTVRKSGFSYEGYAARLLTTQELEKACNITVGNGVEGELDNCNYFLENTSYENMSYTQGLWLETTDTLIDIPNASVYNYRYAWSIYGYDRNVSVADADFDFIYGVRPAIEVNKSMMEIGNDEEQITTTEDNDNSEIVQVEDTALNLRKYLLISGLLVLGFGISMIIYIIKYRKNNKNSI